MENKQLAEKELQDLINKYPTLEFFVTTNFVVGFKEKEAVVTEIVDPTPETVSETTETPVIDAITVEPTLAQPQTDESVETA